MTMVMATIDVASLHTAIPHTGGIKASKVLSMKGRTLLLLLSIWILLYIARYPEKFPALKFRSVVSETTTIPIIFVITPTYARLVQKAELTRLTLAFRQVPALHWIVVEDALQKTQVVRNLLQRSGIPYTHLSIQSLKDVRKARGTLQRNLGLSWLRETFYPEDAPEGVVYFADDDNTYSLEIFEEMRYTKKVSVWPVAFVGGLRYESVKVNMEGKVAGWFVKIFPSRSFAIDMAGFAINLKLILEKRTAIFRLDVAAGYQEPSLLQDLVTMEELEPKADNCTKILVWHTKTQTPNLRNDKNFTDPNVEV
ncbi:PREDICTED: galactosylgalactosylxylosylprotein 3-beta-glucuronosyltransferase 1-like [Nanorana parkeri]|uniref:galactosylgalactosylxylosylprotein 3-beta-glucuronosyltransferase 1-like n=1 Tax=Nanorana parkeri TaxID=125878 RepID=UPI000854D0D9|nr:PREDICTED: galactosylgalactosylxylosylprotein 3-beta-glucuronosyltransferase 1-like [Nanorana parkeri]